MDPLALLANRFARLDRDRKPPYLTYYGVHNRGFKRGYATGLVSVAVVYGLVTLLGSLSGCAPGVPVLDDGDCTATFALAGSTDSYGVYDPDVPCYDDKPDGTRDLSDCCPEGWYTLGLSPEGNGVVCAP